jgi:hypothetical protein
MTVKWQPENAEGTLWSATMADGQQGCFEIQMERSPDGWDWVINHDRRFWGQENTLEQAKIAVATQLEQMGQHFHCARSARSRKMKVADISSAFRTSLVSWRAVPCPKKRSSGGVTHWMFTAAPCGGRKS